MQLFAQNTPTAQLLTAQKVYEAGASIVLEFEVATSATLLCYSSYGSTLIYPNQDLGNGVFNLPEWLTSKKGSIDLQLISERNVIYNGSISILANTQFAPKLASYLGPPSISAGANDYTMMVVIPTDVYDNPLADKTPVAIKHQFLETFKKDTLSTANFIAWQNIYSYTTSGRILVSSSVNGIHSKEFSVEVFPAQPSDFSINYTRKHSYADGNQVTTFTTSVIKDRYGNVISEGTLVDFVIKNTKGAVLKTQGSSIKGVANAQMLHPDYADTWEVTAYISGMAVSKSITVDYQPVTTKLPVAFAKKNRSITVGPLHSFMQQLIPDGAVVTLSIFKEGTLLETKLKTTHRGMVNFRLQEGFYPSATYSFTIEALGLMSKYNNVKL